MTNQRRAEEDAKKVQNARPSADKEAATKAERKAHSHKQKAMEIYLQNKGSYNLGEEKLALNDPRWAETGEFYCDGLLAYFQRTLLRHLTGVQCEVLSLRDLEIFHERHTLG